MSTAFEPSFEPQALRTGLKVAAGCVGLAFLVVLFRLWHLQVTQGESYLQKSQDNFVKDVEIPALRGRIKDRTGHVLVENRAAYNVYVTPRFFPREAMETLRGMLALDEAGAQALWHKLQAPQGLARFRGVLVREDVARDMMALLEMRKQDLPGVAVEVVPHRSYPFGPLASHALGFLNEISVDELMALGKEGYRSGQVVGRSGLEKQWEPVLRGRGGSMRVVVDARGQRKSEEEAKELLVGPSRSDPVPGNDVVLTMDLALQQGLEEAMDKVQAGGAVALEVDTGRILAMASRPAFDPNLLSGRLSRAEDARLSSDPRRPRIDKVLRENYFPGSTFKLVVALAALRDGLVNVDEKVTCKGGYALGKRVFHCMEVHGPVDLISAIVESCNTYFFRLGEKIGMDRMAQTAHDLGLGERTGLGMGGEVPGFVPDTTYYKTTKEGFHPGSTLNMAIGQGSTKVTVLQLALAYAAIANGGTLWTPQIVLRTERPDGRVLEELQPKVHRRIAVSSEHLALLRQALLGVVANPHGTAYAARVPGIDVAGKTGTAQVHNIKQRGRDHIVAADEWNPEKDHAWFVGFAPADHPKIVVAALVEHGGLGARAAAPIVMQVMRRYFAKPAPNTAEVARAPSEVVPVMARKTEQASSDRADDQPVAADDPGRPGD